ncbi:type I-F CRISPR-associated helicase Cas3f [Rahnella woolbedingensis]|uniref:Type I-F CRISPR-associated helicase Cas3 n=1 Tax=Rahnella woolbedingensis TaxID=1510574 RepID=A0A419NE63_9GAMM|nr:type I-F CRISPR-associated helicase Cas3f [Rahnella woolbedingensis]RJT47044.1 type I-F CRISPR-associated helicase Cas3 [Rahnella woolbedingensis]
MNILLVSECSKKALTETRRIVDQFAERKGERTWQTAITLEGLNTLRRILRKTARRNTAVACHWIKSNNQTEVLWIVGNIRKFNYKGSVPTHSTQRDILKSGSENTFHSISTIGLLAAIGGLFHDFGKASKLFQNKLKGQGKSFEPYRHEWISVRLFQAFVGQQTDEQWLTSLQNVSAEDEKVMIQNLASNNVSHSHNSPLEGLPPVARLVAWLIVSHHRLPVYPRQNDNYNNPPQLSEIEHWQDQQFAPCWNSTNMDAPWTSREQLAVWQFVHGTPVQSATWRGKAQKFANRALQLPLFTSPFVTAQQRFTRHLARLVLMLSDHLYSSLEATEGWQDPDFPAIANTDKKSGKPKQHLDEHNIGVCQTAWLLARSLPYLRETLPAISRHKGFKKRAQQEKFHWQDKAFDLACGLRENTRQHGFFGVNMASTGCGKTLANARIMYGLSDEKLGCRFSVALGLRTLTLQTGDALSEKLHLDPEDLAVLIGSQAVQQLHQLSHDDRQVKNTGSQSADDLFAEHQYVRYEGTLDTGRLGQWLKGKDALLKLLSAPVLVTTIDHLIPACESLRGGHQIAPMLRLLTSDLVLDEPDDFDMADLPALCRLVNWAGMLGSRVLLSSATLAPALVQALFSAYVAGRNDYQQANGQPGLPVNVCCAWFDEFHVSESQHMSGKSFGTQHREFVVKRVPLLRKAKPLRQAVLVTVTPETAREHDVLNAVSACVHQSLLELHHAHHKGKKLTVGLIRMANIDPLVAVSQRLMTMPSPANIQIHYCVYHSQYPLAMRAHIENRLDAMLTRNDEKAIWQVDEVRRAFAEYPEKHHIFVVLATSVAEIGRDHDYDWAIAEPSSMRSLIQLAGRVQRHRQSAPQMPNVHILHKNAKALKKVTPAYCKPGFESRVNLLSSHDLHDLLRPEEYGVLNAIPRIQERETPDPQMNLTDMEHGRLWPELLGRKPCGENYAARWWRDRADWCGELQQRTPFRQSAPDKQYYLWLDEEGEEPRFRQPDEGIEGWKDSGGFKAITPICAQGVSPWMEMNCETLYQRLADDFGWELQRVSKTFGEICLPEDENKRWHWHEALGVFGALD